MPKSKGHAIRAIFADGDVITTTKRDIIAVVFVMNDTRINPAAERRNSRMAGLCLMQVNMTSIFDSNCMSCRLLFIFDCKSQSR